MRPGYIAAIVVFGLTLIGTFAAGCGLAIWGAVEGIGETDAYGRVDVPGAADLDLPEGDVSVYFERGGSGENALKSARDDVSLTIVSDSGAPIDLRGRGSVDEQVTDGGTTRVNFDRVEIPEAGVYSVIAETERPLGRGGSLTFGKPLTAGVVDRARNALWGLLGFLLAGAIALITLATSSRGRDESVTMPPQE